MIDINPFLAALRMDVRRAPVLLADGCDHPACGTGHILASGPLIRRLEPGEFDKPYTAAQWPASAATAIIDAAAWYFWAYISPEIEREPVVCPCCGHVLDGVCESWYKEDYQDVGGIIIDRSRCHIASKLPEPHRVEVSVSGKQLTAYGDGYMVTMMGINRNGPAQDSGLPWRAV